VFTGVWTAGETGAGQMFNSFKHGEILNFQYAKTFSFSAQEKLYIVLDDLCSHELVDFW